MRNEIMREHGKNFPSRVPRWIFFNLFTDYLQADMSFIKSLGLWTVLKIGIVRTFFFASIALMEKSLHDKTIKRQS